MHLGNFIKVGLGITKQGIGMAGLGLILVVMGALFALFGVGGKAKFDMGDLGKLSGSGGIVLIVVGVVFLGAGI